MLYYKYNKDPKCGGDPRNPLLIIKAPTLVPLFVLKPLPLKQRYLQTRKVEKL